MHLKVGQNLDYQVLRRASSEEPLLSVILPVYNTDPTYLEECTSSLSRQNVEGGLELIFVDNASTNGVLNDLLDFAHDRDSVAVLKMNENSKQGTARNRGLEVARGDYIGYMDPDDVVSDDYYGSLMQAALETNADMVAASYQRTDQGMNPIEPAIAPYPVDCLGESSVQRTKEMLLVECPIFSCIYRKDLLLGDGCSFPEGVSFEDNPPRVFWKIRCSRLEQTPSGLYFWRQHPASTTALSKSSQKKIKDRLVTSDLFLDDSKRLGRYEQYRDEIDFLYGRLCLYNTMATLASGEVEGKRDLARDVSRHVRSRGLDLMRNPYIRSKSRLERLKWDLALNHPTLFLLLWSIADFAWIGTAK